MTLWSAVRVERVNKDTPALMGAWNAVYDTPGRLGNVTLSHINETKRLDIVGRVSREMQPSAINWFVFSARWRRMLNHLKLSDNKRKSTNRCIPSAVHTNLKGKYTCHHKMCPWCHFRRTLKLINFLISRETRNLEWHQTLIEVWDNGSDLSGKSIKPLEKALLGRRKILRNVMTECLRAEYSHNVVGKWSLFYPVYNQPVFYNNKGLIKDKPPRWRVVSSLRVLLIHENKFNLPSEVFPFPVAIRTGKNFVEGGVRFMRYPHTWALGPEKMVVEIERISRGLRDLNISYKNTSSVSHTQG